MSESKHTPGPWEIAAERPPETSAEWLWIGPAGWKTRVARVVVYDGEQREQQANARLIAACPTMYDYIAKRAADGDADAQAIVEAI